jgi:hypothetical protein
MLPLQIGILHPYKFSNFNFWIIDISSTTIINRVLVYEYNYLCTHAYISSNEHQKFIFSS